MCFWVILLVYFYSYGEYCFSGELENGDLFGGSVSFLNLDSENGNRKGAV
ncbi:hypothetical protein [Winogradskyella vidalii]|nr:hypothetical protein [Winogradskyella vidalii]